jgi:hypothetical protein
MDPWVKWPAFVVGVWLVDQAFSWLERRGWIYWKGTPKRMQPVEHPAPPGARTSVFLAPCDDCGYHVSTRAPLCPSCGRVLRPWLLVAAAFLISFIAVWLWRLIEALAALARQG